MITITKTQLRALKAISANANEDRNGHSKVVHCYDGKLFYTDGTVAVQLNTPQRGEQEQFTIPLSCLPTFKTDITVYTLTRSRIELSDATTTVQVTMPPLKYPKRLPGMIDDCVSKYLCEAYTEGSRLVLSCATYKRLTALGTALAGKDCYIKVQSDHRGPGIVTFDQSDEYRVILMGLVNS